MLQPVGITIYDLVLEGQPYLGIVCSCSWDQEHGFGVMLCGRRVVKIGDADTALLRWVAKRDIQEYKTISLNDID